MITTALIVLSACTAQAPDLDAFLQAFRESQGKVQTFRARFIQVEDGPDGELRTPGTVVYRKPRRLVYRTEPMVTIVDGGTSYEYERELKQLLVDDISGTPLEDLFFFGFDAKVEDLRAQYDLRAFEEPGDPIGRRRLAIRPFLEDQEATPFREVIIRFRDEDFLPHNIQIQTDEELSTTYILNAYEVNPELSEPELELVLPEGAIVVERGEVVEEVGPDGKRVPAKLVNPDPTLPSRLAPAPPAAAPAPPAAAPAE